MTFADKLNFLMTITKTSNSVLAGRVSLDASYISRLRSGKRNMPKDTSIIQVMAVSLARRCSEDYQRKAVSDALKLAFLPGEGAALAEDIANWLIHNDADSADQVGRFLSDLSGLDNRLAPTDPENDCQPPYPLNAVSIYYGIEGKRRAAEYFLTEVAAREKPQTLLLFSDEETSWMTANLKYAQKWMEIMSRVLTKGNKIKIIHTISRNLDEMLSALSQWMPLYMSGNIEPYFYPKKRDGIFKRTLFIAPETAAVVSNSIGEQISLAANVLHRDRTAVASYTEEFLQYLRLCRPLMRIFTASNLDACFDTLEEFDVEQADSLLQTESLSVLTMPENLMKSIIKRADIDASNYLPVYKARRDHFLENLNTNHFTELIHLPDTETVKSGRVKVTMSDMLDSSTVLYTQEEYAAHLEQVIALLASNDNYHIVLIDRPLEDRYTIYAREDLGVIVAKTSQPPVVLAMNESNMVAAFWDYLKDMAGEKTYANPNNKSAIASLRAYLDKLGN